MAREDNARWLVVYMAHGKQHADRVEGLLQGEGFLVKRRRVERSASEADATFELLVLGSEAPEARSYLVEKGL